MTMISFKEGGMDQLVRKSPKGQKRDCRKNMGKEGGGV